MLITARLRALAASVNAADIDQRLTLLAKEAARARTEAEPDWARFVRDCSQKVARGGSTALVQCALERGLLTAAAASEIPIQARYLLRRSGGEGPPRLSARALEYVPAIWCQHSYIGALAVLDPNTLASGGRDESICVWDLETGVCKRRIEDAATDSVTALAAHPDGRRLVVNGRDDEIAIWDAHTGERLDVVETNGGYSQLAFLADGRLFWSHYDTLGIYDLDARRSVARRTFDDSVRVSVSPQGIAVIANEELVELSTELEDLRRFKLDGEAGTQMALAEVLLWAGPDLWVHAEKPFSDPCPLRITTLLPTLSTHELSGHEGSIEAMHLHPDGRRLFTLGNDGSARIWDLERRMCLAAVQVHTWGSAAVLHPDGRHLITAGGDDVIRLWDLDALSADHSASLGKENYVACAALSPQGTRAVTIARTRAVLWQPSSGQKLLDLSAEGIVTGAFTHDDELVAVAPSHLVFVSPETPTVRRIAVEGKLAGPVAIGCGHVAACVEQQLCLWNVTTGQERKLEAVDLGFIETVAFAEELRLVVACGRKWAGAAWSVDTGKKVRAWPDARAARVTSDGRHVLLSLGGTWADSVEVQSLESGETATDTHMGGDHFVLNAVGEHEGRLYAVSAAKTGAKRLWRAWSDASETVRFSLQGPVPTVIYPRFAVVDGYLGAVADDDGSLFVWDLRDGKVLRRINVGGNQGDVHAFAHRQVALRSGKRILIWSLESGELVAWKEFSESVSRWQHIGSRVLVGDFGGGLSFWNPGTGEVQVGQKHGDFIAGLCVLGGEVFVTTSTDGTACAWRGTDPSPIATLSRMSRDYHPPLAAVDGAALMVNEDGTVVEWRPQQNQLRTLDDLTHVVHIAAAPDQRVAFCSADGDVSIRSWSDPDLEGEAEVKDAYATRFFGDKLCVCSRSSIAILSLPDLEEVRCWRSPMDLPGLPPDGRKPQELGSLLAEKGHFNREVGESETARLAPDRVTVVVEDHSLLVFDRESRELLARWDCEGTIRCWSGDPSGILVIVDDAPSEILLVVS